MIQLACVGDTPTDARSSAVTKMTTKINMIDLNYFYAGDFEYAIVDQISFQNGRWDPLRSCDFLNINIAQFFNHL